MPIKSSFMRAPGPARATPIGLLLIAVVLGLGGVVLQGSPVNVRAFLFFNDLAPQWGAVGSWFSILGLGSAALIVAGSAGPRRATALAAVLMALLVCGTLVQSLKALVNEARPLAVLGPDAMHVVGMSLRGKAMPSGHAAAGACAAAMALGAARADRRYWPLAVALIVFAVLTAWARMVVGAHWPSDVLAGAGLGLFAGTLVYGIPAGRRICASLAGWLRGRAGSFLAGLLLIAVAVSLWRTQGEYPLASWVSAALSLLGVLAALLWWRPHLHWPGRRAPDGAPPGMAGPGS
jgi:membrane-associated phospholipid phosphatase